MGASCFQAPYYYVWGGATSLLYYLPLQNHTGRALLKADC